MTYAVFLFLDFREVHFPGKETGEFLPEPLAQRDSAGKKNIEKKPIRPPNTDLITGKNPVLFTTFEEEPNHRQMNLEDFIVNKRSGNEILFNDERLMNLERFLNGNCYRIGTTDFFLERLCFLRDNWKNAATRDAYIESELGGYWEENYLLEHKLEPGWFSFMSYEDLEGYMHHSRQLVYIMNDLALENPVAELSLDSLIDLLEQRKRLLEKENERARLHWWQRWFRK